jgi:DNA-binding XRE family transcriptional regulator
MRAEDRADALAAADAEQRRREGEEYLPVEMVDRILAGESALKVWRNHRGMTPATLGKAAGVGQSHLSQIENGSRRGTPSLRRRLAAALHVSADEILPLD